MPPAVVYVSNADSREIHVLSLDGGTGAVSLVQRMPVPGAVMPLAVSPSRRVLYAGLRSAPFAVSTLAIDTATGTLTLLATAPLPDNMAYLSTDTTGRFLFGASYAGDRISVQSIGEEGLVQARPVQVLPTSSHPHSIIIDRSNRYLFVPSLGADRILQYTFDQTTGHIVPNAPPFVEAAKGAGPRHLVFHPGGRFAYATNELDATVGAYQFDAAAGTLRPAGTARGLPPDFAGHPPFAAADLHVTPDGRFLYASERASSTLAAFRIDGGSGLLAPSGNFSTEQQPRGFNIDPRGRYLFAVGQLSHSMTVHAIDQTTGALAPRHRYPMGQNPNWVEIVDRP